MSSRRPIAEILAPRPSPPLNIGVSACLVGQEVRYDGGHKQSSMPHALLAGLYEYRPLCPEVGIGLGTPREVIRLVGADASPRAVSTNEAVGDVTQRLRGYAGAMSDRLADLDGYIFMKSSPSCGVYRVKVYKRENAAPTPAGTGIYARAVMDAWPELPIEDSGRLFDAVLRENFVMRTFAHAHWRAVVAEGLTAERLIAFHSAYKFLIMAHDVEAYRTLGRLLSNLKQDLEETSRDYVAGLMRALAKPAKRGGHANVLAHLQGYAKIDMPARSRQELAGLIESYRRGEVPLLAPLALLKHHLRDHDAQYALDQVYLDPHPGSAGLRREL